MDIPSGRFGRIGNAGGDFEVFDVNGDKLPDVVTALAAHGFGLAWYEQKKGAPGAESTWVEHMIMGDFARQNPGGVTFTELHALTIADMDGDGMKDIVTGKRMWAHEESYTDPDPMGPAVLYWFSTIRDPKAAGGARFVPEMIHNRSGVGSMVLTADLNKDGATDVMAGTNRGGLSSGVFQQSLLLPDDRSKRCPWHCGCRRSGRVADARSSRAHEALRRPAGARQRQLRAATGRDRRLSRPERIRQEHHRQHGRRPARAERRVDLARRPHACRDDPIALQARIGYVPEEPYLYTHLTAAEYLTLVGRLRGMPPRRSRRESPELLQLFQLHDSRYRTMAAFSKGMRQRVLLAAALLHNPDLLVLDEPFSGLDVNAGLLFRALLGLLAAEGRMILFSTHRFDMVEKLCSRVVMLSSGRIVAEHASPHLASDGRFARRDLLPGDGAGRLPPLARRNPRHHPSITMRALLDDRPWYQLRTHFFRRLFDFGLLSDAGSDAFRRVLIGLTAVVLSFGLLLTRMYLGKYTALAEKYHDWGTGYQLNREPFRCGSWRRRSGARVPDVDRWLRRGARQQLTLSRRD